MPYIESPPINYYEVAEKRLYIYGALNINRISLEHALKDPKRKMPVIFVGQSIEMVELCAQLPYTYWFNVYECPLNFHTLLEAVAWGVHLLETNSGLICMCDAGMYRSRMLAALIAAAMGETEFFDKDGITYLRVGEKVEEWPFDPLDFVSDFKTYRYDRNWRKIAIRFEKFIKPNLRNETIT